MDVQKLFDNLESNNSHESEEAKKKLAECINQTKDLSILHGVMDYYVRTNSLRIIDVLVKVQSPNDMNILDRIAEWMRGSNRTVALDLLGFIIRKHPTWLYKIGKHKLIKEILKLLQNEKEIIHLMSALLCIITLLPIIPSLVPSFLSDLFDGFGHLAMWNAQNANSLHESQIIHVQIGMYLLFHYLYGMYPNCFIRYLRRFATKDSAIFQSSIRPLLETVRMHPMLVVGSSEDETTNNTRWKEKEPHDIVVECAKLSLDYNQDNVEYFCKNLMINRNLVAADADITHLQIGNWHGQPALCVARGVASPFRPLVAGSNLLDVEKLIHPIWSPSVEILATPPPTGTVTHTPTPIYSVPNVLPTNLLGPSGASPPEAAVEATPETTPLKDLSLKPIMVTKSPAVRAVLASSQPSSPARNEPSAFQFELPMASHGASQVAFIDPKSASQRRLLKVLNDRDQSQKHMLLRSRSVDPTVMIPTAVLPISHCTQTLQSAYLQQLDSPTNITESTQEDQEVFELTNTNYGANHSDTLQDISPDCGDDTEQLPCSMGTLNTADCQTMSLQERHALRNRCINDNSSYLSYGTSPADHERSDRFRLSKHTLRVRRSRSWPALKKSEGINEHGTNVDVVRQTQYNFQANGESSSPSGDDAMSAATHFKQIQQKAKLRRRCDNRFTDCLKHSSTQTLPLWRYEEQFFELFIEQSKLRRMQNKAFDPYEVLDRCVNRNITETKKGEEVLKEQIRLLHLLLNFERYRREVHAERNRRLLGKSRAVLSEEKDKDRLKDQIKNQQTEIDSLSSQVENYRRRFNHRQDELQSELNLWKTKYHKELDTIKQLRSYVETLQKRLVDEGSTRKEMTLQIEAFRGELFDMRNEMQQIQYQAELGLQYKQELVKLQTELLAVGEIQVKCRDRLADLDSLKARDEEAWHLQESYSKEIRDTRTAFESKSAQYDTVIHQIASLQATNAAKDINFTEQKRLFKSAKEEYDEKFKALEGKYEIQKSIILQMEKHIAELYRNQAANTLATTTPESEKTDFISSIEHNSPLSMSLTSNEGLSTSLKSVTEIRNLHALVVSPLNTANEHHYRSIPVTSSSVISFHQAASSHAVVTPTSSAAISMRRSSSTSNQTSSQSMFATVASTSTTMFSDQSTRLQNISSTSSSSSSAL